MNIKCFGSQLRAQSDRKITNTADNLFNLIIVIKVFDHWRRHENAFCAALFVKYDWTPAWYLCFRTALFSK